MTTGSLAGGFTKAAQLGDRHKSLNTVEIHFHDRDSPEEGK